MTDETRRNCQDYQPYQPPGLQIAQPIFIALYLIFGLVLQDVNFASPPGWWSTFFATTAPFLANLPAPINFFLHLLTPSVWLHLVIPAILGYSLASAGASNLVHQFYDLPSRQHADFYLRRLMGPRRIYGSPAPPQRVIMNNLRLTGWIVGMALAALVLARIFFSQNPFYIVLFQATIFGIVAWIGLLGIMIYSTLSARPRGSSVGINRETFAKQKVNTPLLRVGGPGKVGIGVHDVITTEQNARFCRVLGPGGHTLAPFESVRTVLDLRQHDREGEVSAITKDGIRVKMKIGVSFRLLSDDSAESNPAIMTEVPETPVEPVRPTTKKLYPFSEKAVQKAAYGGGWENKPIGTVSGQVGGMIATYRFDELFQLDDFAQDPLPTLHDIVLQNARAGLRNSGIDLLSVRLGAIRPDEPVTHQQIKSWRAFWQKQDRITQARAEADALTELATARRDVETAMLQAIVDGIQTARHETGNEYITRGIVALRMVETLEKLAHQSNVLSGPAGHNLIGHLQDLQHAIVTERIPTTPLLDEPPGDEEA